VADEAEKDDLQAIRADLAALVAKVDRISGDIAKENLPPGELEAFYKDLTQFRLEIDELVTQVDQLEGRKKRH
jgi:ubiquinone biosynthesis protein UbiJ